MSDPKKDLILIGASGFGREVAWLVERINLVKPTWNLLGFLDDNPELTGQCVDGYSVLGTCNEVKNYPNAWFVCAIGASRIRRQVIERLGDVMFATLVDPSVLFSERVTIGEGTIVCAGSILTVDIEIGRHVIVNLDCTVGHDDVIQNYVTLYPSVNVSGKVTIEETTEIGTGAQIIQGKRIGSDVIVGAGAVVIRDIPDHCTAVGNPARVIKD